MNFLESLKAFLRDDLGDLLRDEESDAAYCALKTFPCDKIANAVSAMSHSEKEEYVAAMRVGAGSIPFEDALVFAAAKEWYSQFVPAGEDPYDPKYENELKNEILFSMGWI